MLYELIVFDWDGTLYNSAGLIVECVQLAAQEHGFTVPSSQLIKQNIGLSIDEAINRNLPDLSPVQKANLIQTYRELLVTRANKPVLFEGAADVLATLKKAGYLLAIATSKDSVGLAKDLELLDIAHYFVMTRSADQAESKPHPQMLNDILDQLGMLPEKALVIGDTEFDMLMAANANVDGVAVSYGVHSVERLKMENVQTILHDIRELPAWLTQDKSFDN